MEKQFEFLIYQAAEENVFVNALIKDETIWIKPKGYGRIVWMQYR